MKEHRKSHGDELSRARPGYSEHSSKRRRSRSRSKDREVERGRDKHSQKKRKSSVERKSRKEPKEDTSRTVDLGAYTELDNPFNDINLGTQFMWQKKLEKERKRGVSPNRSRQLEASRRQEAKDELELLNRRRIEREAEQQLREEEEARMSRLAETTQMSEWLAKEGDFQLEQERTRAAIRLKEKRAKAVDFLSLNLKYASTGSDDDQSWSAINDEGLEIDLDEPYAMFENLSLEQTEELHDDIQRYLTLEKRDINITFWTNMMVVCEDRLDVLRTNRRLGPDSKAQVADTDAAVQAEIASLLSGKTLQELSDLQRQVQLKLSSGEPVDIDYWEALLRNLFIWKAKGKLKGIHEVVVRNRLEQLRKRQRDEAHEAQQELLADVWTGSSDLNNLPDGESHQNSNDSKVVEYQTCMSPTLTPLQDVTQDDRHLQVVSELEDNDRLIAKRRSVADTRFVTKPSMTIANHTDLSEAIIRNDVASETLWQVEAENNLEEEEEAFNMEESLPNPTSYTWEDKYRPRKPKYFNRVHTGYEWNKYNQTHYDTDNPPPKVVQGYKFNIFYPDLIDKTKAPTFKIVHEPGNTETVLLHFIAGPPYEDIAFRIVNREWEYSHKRGFRSSFDRGCLSLWFNFRRNFYRK